MANRSATLTFMRQAGIELTLDNWLELNAAKDALDAELLEIIPERFRDEYERRLVHNAGMEGRWEAQQQQGEDEMEHDRR